MNVLDLRGPEFLELYVSLLAVAVVLAVSLRWALRGPGGDVPSFATALDPYEVAYLAGGTPGAVDSAIAALVHRGAVRVRAGQLEQDGVCVGELPPLERLVYGHLERGRESLPAARKAARPFANDIGGRLRAMGVALTPEQSARVRLLPATGLALVLLLGIVKIMVGMSRNRPVSYLVLLCLLTFVAAAMFVMAPAVRTRCGDRLLRSLRTRNQALRTSVGRGIRTLGSTDIAVALALFGPAMLAAGPLSDLRQALSRSRSGSGSNWTGFGCGGGGCGGGGCGGGGCGGGGCGGCGGG